MDIDIPIWTLIPTLMFITSIYIVIPHMSYSSTEWLIGNSLITLGVGTFYLGNYTIKKYWRKD